MRIVRGLRSGILALTCSGLSAAILAPASLAQVVSPDGSIALQGIVVVGEKVSRSLQDTTSSVTVFTGEEIKSQQIQDIQEVINKTPNAIAAEGNRGNSGFVIRGLNSEGLTENQHQAAAALISVIIDGATQNPEATRRGARSLWDVEQVEIYRGPQSTLQARNSLAGAVFIKTNDPVYRFESVVEATLGSYGLWSRGFVVNAPIVDNQLAVRVAGQLVQGERDIRYTFPAHDKLDDDRLASIRGKVLIQPSSVPGLTVLLTAARTEDRPAVTAVSGPNFFARLFSGSASTGVDFRATDADNYISDVSYRLSPNLKLRSVTALANTITDIGSPTGADLQRDDTRKGGDFTQDLRLEIENKGNGLSGVVGLFYGRFDMDIKSNITFPIFGVPTVVQDLKSDTTTTTAAAYADLRFRFLDRFQLIAGGRLLHDTVESNSLGQSFFVPVNEANKDEFTRFLPKAGITYDLTSDQTVGFTYSKGYRPGFTQVTLGGDVNKISPEELDAYELSYRSRWLNGTVNLNANVFYYDYRKQQGVIPDPLAPDFFVIIVNSDKSHAYGGEVEIKWSPTPRWQLFAGLGLLQTRFDRFVTLQGDFSGKEFPEAPTITATAGALYKDPSGWFAGANLRYVDGYFSTADVANTVARRAGDYTLVDASVGYEWDKTKLTLFVKNLFDEHYLTSISSTSGGAPPEAIVGDSRLVGVTLTQRF